MSGSAAHAATHLVLLASLSVLPSCSLGGPKNFENENDRLRAENLTLQRQVEELREKAALRAGELEALQQQGGAAAPIDGASPPTVAGIKLDRYTSAVDTDNDGADDAVRIYLRPVDRDGRLLVSAARVTVQVVSIREGRPPSTVAERTFTPPEFDAAYRSGFAGTHYTLELQLPSPLPDEAVGPGTIQVTFTDAATGATFTEQRATTIERAAAPVQSGS